MARARKRHVQEELFGPCGGIRRSRSQPSRKKHKRPGRKPKGARAGSPHKKRPEINRHKPVHVVLKVVKAIGSLRKRLMYRALREATLTVALREVNAITGGAFRIVHISIQRTHIHLLVEADNKTALSRGMQSFQISAAKHLNSAVSVQQKLERRRRGTVFPDRFHQEVIATPTQARHALAYVLNNWRKHREDKSSREARTWNVDPFSTGALFAGWKERADEPLLWKWRDTYDPLVVYLPSSWLLAKGWRKSGRSISFHDVPSQPLVRT